MTFFVFIGKTTYWRSKKYQFCDGIYLNNISNNQSMPATNRRFGISGGVSSQKHLCIFSSLSPVQTVVSRHLRQAAGRCVQA